MRISIFTFIIFLSILSVQAQWNDNETNLTTSDNVGIGTTSPSEKFHVNGNIGIGLMAGTSIEGIKIEYVDGGSGTTTFKHARWGGNIYFKRSSSLGERTQFFFGGSSNHRMDVYNSNNEVKLRLNSGGNSFFNGGNVGIGTSNPDAKLTVAGNIHSREVKVTINAGADFVFENNYNLPSLESIERYIKENKHLPEIASEKEMKERGLLLAEMNIKLLQKIEELTLYTIQQQKEIEKLKLINEKFIELQSRLEKLESKI